MSDTQIRQMLSELETEGGVVVDLDALDRERQAPGARATPESTAPESHPAMPYARAVPKAST